MACYVQRLREIVGPDGLLQIPSVSVALRDEAGRVLVARHVEGETVSIPSMARSLTRRSLLGVLTAAAAAKRDGMAMTAQPDLRPIAAAVDHLLLGAKDLDQGIAWVEKLTGVRAVIGGTHPGRGTRNALVAFEGRRYLEIIAPDPAQPPSNLRLNLQGLAEPRLIAWAAATSDIDALAKRVPAVWRTVAAPRAGSRSRPDGRVLKWRTLDIQTELSTSEVDPIPFFIEWASDSIHPSEDSAKGCDLVALELEHPDAARVTETLRQLGIDAAVRQSAAARLMATVTSPRGRVALT